jgi:RNA polymerase sigma-70 factor, ECF subfamily
MVPGGMVGVVVAALEVQAPAAVVDPEVLRLVREAQAGSAHAFAEIYDRYVDQVYAYVYHRVGQRHTAEDLTSDVFVNALRRIGTYRYQGVDPGAWLITIARNRCHDHFKSARFRLEAPVEDVFDSSGGTGSGGVAPGASAEDQPEAAALTREVAREVHAALARLKGEQAEVLYLRFVQQLSVTEVATVMGRNEQSIRALQYRALKALAKVVPEGLVS